MLSFGIDTQQCHNEQKYWTYYMQFAKDAYIHKWHALVAWMIYIHAYNCVCCDQHLTDGLNRNIWVRINSGASFSAHCWLAFRQYRNYYSMYYACILFFISVDTIKKKLLNVTFLFFVFLWLTRRCNSAIERWMKIIIKKYIIELLLYGRIVAMKCVGLCDYNSERRCMFRGEATATVAPSRTSVSCVCAVPIKNQPKKIEIKRDKGRTMKGTQQRKRSVRRL